MTGGVGLNHESRGRRPRLSSKEEKEENLLFDIIIYDIGLYCLTLTIRSYVLPHIPRLNNRVSAMATVFTSLTMGYMGW